MSAMAVVLLNVGVVSKIFEQQCLLAMLEKRKRTVSKSNFILRFASELKSSCYLNYEILIADMNTYGVSLPVLRMMRDFLLHRKQRTKISSSYCEMVFGVFIFSCGTQNSNFKIVNFCIRNSESEKH